MKKYIFLLSLFPLYYIAHSQSTTVIRGRVLTIKNLTPVPLAGITIGKGAHKYVSNRQGYFLIEASPTDTMIISAIGYLPFAGIVGNIALAAQGDTALILLTPVTYQLREVNVIRSSPRRDSLARLAAQFLAKDALMNDYDRILKRPRGGWGPQDSGCVIYEGLIQDLYNKFSKEGKDNIHFEEFLKYARLLHLAEKRYNKLLVKKVTGLNDARLDDFMIHCTLDKNFVTTSTDYELILAIRKCGEEYTAIK